MSCFTEQILACSSSGLLNPGSLMSNVNVAAGFHITNKLLFRDQLIVISRVKMDFHQVYIEEQTFGNSIKDNSN